MAGGSPRRGRHPAGGFAQVQRRSPNTATAGWPAALLLAAVLGGRVPATAQDLLAGEFGDIQLGRELVVPGRFPTLRELRQAVRRPELQLVLMFKLYGDSHQHHLPIWSEDGERLAFQRRTLQGETSKLLLYQTLSQAQPTLVTQDDGAYDYMFRWGLNSATSFAFARIESGRGQTQIYYSPDGSALELRTAGSGQAFYPALYERTDGIRWLAYERQGQLVHQAWSGVDRNEQVLTAGTTPRWSRDGRRLLMARQREDGLAAYDVLIRQLREGSDAVVARVPNGLVRSPVWSPDEQSVAWFQQDARQAAPWQIQAGSASSPAPPRLVLGDVVVNPDYKSEGPSWEPDGRRIWCFSHAHRRQEYYPLIGAGIESGAAVQVDYPTRYTAANDLAVNPVTAIPEFAFTARDGASRDLFIVLLNHY